MTYPAGVTPVHFLRLTLEQNGKPRSTNFYLRGVEQGNFRALRSLPRARVPLETSVEQHDSTWLLTTTSKTPPHAGTRCFASKQSATQPATHPAVSSDDDNYIALFRANVVSSSCGGRRTPTPGASVRASSRRLQSGICSNDAQRPYNWVAAYLFRPSRNHRLCHAPFVCEPSDSAAPAHLTRAAEAAFNDTPSPSINVSTNLSPHDSRRKGLADARPCSAISHLGVPIYDRWNEGLHGVCVRGSC